jgi:hypothetical protein
MDNMGIQQMPLLLASHGKADARQVERLVDSWETSGDESAYDVVVKPTHLSNSTGTLVLSEHIWESCEYSAEALVDHMDTFMSARAHETESAALQSLIPGFVIQPRYISRIHEHSDRQAPIEIRVITLWGKTRLGIWWWGPGRKNAWIVQQPEGQARDRWHVIHDSKEHDAEYESILRLVVKEMPGMAKAAERIATAVGAPFLRSDFFVGSSAWGVRLNEVAYGSNIELRRLEQNIPGYVDDSAHVAQILQAGFKHCSRQPPEYFFSRLGVQGESYEPEWWKFWNQTEPGMRVSQTRTWL